MSRIHDSITDDQIRDAFRNYEAIYEAGFSHDLKDELKFVRQEYRERRQSLTIGEELNRDVLADDLAKILGIDRERCQRVARQQLSWQATAVNLLARMAREARRAVRR